MDAINSLESKKLNAINNMQRLEKAVLYKNSFSNYPIIGLLIKDQDSEEIFHHELHYVFSCLLEFPQLSI